MAPSLKGEREQRRGTHEQPPDSTEAWRMIMYGHTSRLRICSPETVLAVPSRVSQLISILRPNLVLTYGIPPEFRGGVHLFILNRHTASGHSRVYRVTQFVPMAFTAESPPAQGASKPQGSSEGVLPWQFYHGPRIIRLSFPHPVLV